MPGAGAVGPRWGLGDAVAGVVAAYVLATLAGGLVFEATGHEPDDAPMWMVGLLQLPFWAGLVGAVAVASWRKGAGDLGVDFGLRARPGDWVGLPAGALLQWPGVWLLYLPILWVLGDQDVEGPARELTERADGAGVVVLVAMVVIGAPLVEELFFRGLVLRSLERRLGPRPALVVSAAAFALFHGQALQAPALFAFGLLAGWLAQRAGRLGPAVAAHVGFNAVTVALLLATG